jgi:hypothetical protein
LTCWNQRKTLPYYNTLFYLHLACYFYGKKNWNKHYKRIMVHVSQSKRVKKNKLRAYFHVSLSLPRSKEMGYFHVCNQKPNPSSFWRVFQKKKPCQGEMASSSYCSGLPIFFYLNSVKCVGLQNYFKKPWKPYFIWKPWQFILHDQACAQSIQ